jgi:hypothetical protein
MKEEEEEKKVENEVVLNKDFCIRKDLTNLSKRNSIYD